MIGDAVLRDKARAVTADEINDDLREVLSKMSRLMYASKGVGLAAKQVGIDKRFLVADAGDGLYKLINPVVVKKEGVQCMEEGCLSVPEVYVKVNRAEYVVLKALDEHGKNIELKADGLLSRVFQHEIDHLDGRLIVDYLNWVGKIKLKKKLSGRKIKA